MEKMITSRIQFLLALLFCVPACAATYETSTVVPPGPRREFRGAWITTVANLDWPSQPGLPVEQQKAELVAILDQATKLRLNAVVFQVRPACDAMYASKIEPWSEYLTGKMGQVPDPYYDPLQFAIEQAHKRGLELHAWFNPYRASHTSQKSAFAANHISRSRPDLVRRYGSLLWLDPGERDVQDYILRVVLDVVRRYDVDGVHFDDYFYPDPLTDRNGRKLDFPDDASWRKYGLRTGLSRDDWRRENVNSLVERAHNSIKAAKPWVKFGISPRGIWRPNNPPQIRGKDAYLELHADSRKWLMNGWVDYLAPQLYWQEAKKEQSFSVLLNWWDAQNPMHRHIWPGLNTYKVLDGWDTEEIVRQVLLAGRQPVSAGHIHFDMRPLMRSTELGRALERGPYAQPALVPASPWKGRAVTNKPVVAVSEPGAGGLRFIARPATGERVARWVLQLRFDGSWTTEFVPGETLSRILGSGRPEVIAVTAIDRFGNASPASVLERKRK